MNRAAEIVDVAFSFRAAQSTDKNWKRYVNSMGDFTKTRRPRMERIASPQEVAHLLRLGRKAG